MTPGSPRQIGTVRCPSGIVTVLDAGLLGLWCHRDFEGHEWWPLPDEIRAVARDAVDLEIVGPDAESASRAFDRQPWSPRHLFDIPEHKLDEVRDALAECVLHHGLEASLRALEHRVPHRERIDLAVTGRHPAVGQMQFHGMWAAVVGGIPSERDLPVVACSTPDEHLLHRVDLVVTDAPAAREIPVGLVMVDHARLMFADADALGDWQHDKPMDGCADGVFWGRDAEAIAARVDAPALGDDQFGWVDINVDAAADHLEAAIGAKRDGEMAAFDFRPHSHHWQLMAQIRERDAGVVELGSARLCGFHTSWGDGVFEVRAVLDADDELSRVRVVFAEPDQG